MREDKIPCKAIVFAAVWNPTDIGRELGGKSAQAANLLLTERGLQTPKRDAKNRHYYEPTEAGLKYAVWLDTGKQHGDGTPVRQLKWTTEVVAVLAAQPEPVAPKLALVPAAPEQLSRRGAPALIGVALTGAAASLMPGQPAKAALLAPNPHHR